MGAERELGAPRTRVKCLDLIQGKMDLKLENDRSGLYLQKDQSHQYWDGRGAEGRTLLCAGENGCCTNTRKLVLELTLQGPYDSGALLLHLCM